MDLKTVVLCEHGCGPLLVDATPNDIARWYHIAIYRDYKAAEAARNQLGGT